MGWGIHIKKPRWLHKTHYGFKRMKNKFIRKGKRWGKLAHKYHNLAKTIPGYNKVEDILKRKAAKYLVPLEGASALIQLKDDFPKFLIKYNRANTSEKKLMTVLDFVEKYGDGPLKPYIKLIPGLGKFITIYDLYKYIKENEKVIKALSTEEQAKLLLQIAGKFGLAMLPPPVQWLWDMIIGSPDEGINNIVNNAPGQKNMEPTVNTIQNNEIQSQAQPQIRVKKKRGTRIGVNRNTIQPKSNPIYPVKTKRRVRKTISQPTTKTTTRRRIRK